jgi:phosphate/sulfate permease
MASATPTAPWPASRRSSPRCCGSRTDETMLILVALAIGAFVGWRRAAARGGDRLDRLQYAAAHGIAFALALLVLSILAERLGIL